MKTQLKQIGEQFTKNKKRHALFRCCCGKEKIMRIDVVRRGALSCGCLRNEANRNTQTTHGMSRTAFYRTFVGISRRCNYPEDKDYQSYGGRGIQCLWESFIEFKKSMFSSYKPGMTIERIDNNGNYCEENCRWATKKEQARNRRNNMKIVFNGETRCLSEWAEFLGVNRHVLQNRLCRGWNIKDAFTKEVQNYVR